MRAPLESFHGSLEFRIFQLDVYESVATLDNDAVHKVSGRTLATEQLHISYLHLNISARIRSTHSPTHLKNTLLSYLWDGSRI